MRNATVLRVLVALAVVGLALGLNAVAVFAGSQNVPDKETRRELASVRQATAKYHKFERACAQGYSRGSDYVPHMGLHFLKPALIITDKHEFDVTTPTVLLYVPRGNDKMKLVAVEYLALAGQIPDEIFSGVGPDAWDPVPGTSETVWGLHAWVWKDNPDGVFAPFNPKVPFEGIVRDCSSAGDQAEDGNDDEDEDEGGMMISDEGGAGSISDHS